MRIGLITWVIVWLIVGIIFMGLISNVYGDYFRTIGVYHKYEPQVCIMYPDPELEPRLEMLSKVTFSAINEWQDKLVNATGGNWNMPIKEYDWSEHGTADVSDYPDCTLFINYPEGVEDESVGRTGFDFSSSKRYYYWVEVDMNTVERKVAISLGESVNESTISVNTEWREIPESDIRNIVLHEFGHGLGLEHYYVTSNCIEEECDYSPIMFHAIDVFEGEVKNVTDKDISMLERIYGSDGFGGMKPKWIPRTCDVECLEVDCGNSRMC